MKFGLLAVCAFLLSACGYQVVGQQSSLLPKDTRTIALIPWANASIDYELSNYLAASVAREFISRTRYRIVSDPSKADVIFKGSVANLNKGGTLYDNTTGRTTGGQVTVFIQFQLVDRTGKVLFNKPNTEFHQPYEISINPTQYFDESQAAEKRLSDDIAKSVVSTILSQF
jgi:hypothetical protein